MSLDYNRFEFSKTKTLPNILRATNHNKNVCQLHTGIRSHFGITNDSVFTDLSRLKLNEMLDVYKDTKEFVFVGIEVELERFRRTHEVATSNQEMLEMLWLQKEDGSLRNSGIEFVSRFGLIWDQVPMAVQELEEYVTTVTNGKAEANARTGLHVHIDVTQLTCYQLANLLFLYSILEPLIFHVSGGRGENVFCVPWETNRFTLGSVVNKLTSIGMREMRWRNYSKYCGLNLAAMSNYGTIEFRMHKGTYKAEEIQKWVDFIAKLYLYAKMSDFVENLQRFRTERDDDKYWSLIELLFSSYDNDLASMSEEKRTELIIRCKYATITFLKHFVDLNKMPDSVGLNNNRAVFDRDIEIEEFLGYREDEEDMHHDGESPEPPVFNFRWPDAPVGAR